jgi:cytochrome b
VLAGVPHSFDASPVSSRDVNCTGTAERASAPRPVLVWDLPTRLFHWLIVVLVAAAYLTERLGWMHWHVRIGESLLALLIFRLLWGWVGSETARFRSFLASPARALRHLRRWVRRGPDPQVGHNPAGGWMVLCLLALLLGEALTGIYINNDIANQGPLTDWVPAPLANGIMDLHAWLWDALLGAVALHVAVIVLYAAKGDNLLGPMLTGRKRLPPGTRAPRQAPIWLALVLSAGAALLAALLMRYL